MYYNKIHGAVQEKSRNYAEERWEAGSGKRGVGSRTAVALRGIGVRCADGARFSAPSEGNSVLCGGSRLGSL